MRSGQPAGAGAGAGDDAGAGASQGAGKDWPPPVFERSALVIDFDFDTPVFRAASFSVVRLYRP